MKGRRVSQSASHHPDELHEFAASGFTKTQFDDQFAANHRRSPAPFPRRGDEARGLRAYWDSCRRCGDEGPCHFAVSLRGGERQFRGMSRLASGIYEHLETAAHGASYWQRRSNAVRSSQTQQMKEKPVRPGLFATELSTGDKKRPQMNNRLTR